MNPEAFKGHRIMVQVQSSLFPLLDRNPQVFTHIYHADESPYRAATHTVFRCRDAASRLVLGVFAGE
jgi:predicted acyl esterase